MTRRFPLRYDPRRRRKGTRWLPIVLSLLFALSLLSVAVQRDRADEEAGQLWEELGSRGGEAQRFQVEWVDELPPPARRYLLRAIAPLTVLASSVELSLEGEARREHGGALVPFSGVERLAPDEGFVFRGAQGEGWLGESTLLDRLSAQGATGGAESRRWLFGLVPVRRYPEQWVERILAERLAAELLWFPPALLPQRGAKWSEVDEARARVSVSVRGRPYTLELTVDEEGRPTALALERFRPPFAGREGALSTWVFDQLDEEEQFEGYTLPTRLRGSWVPNELERFDALYYELKRARFFFPPPQEQSDDRPGTED